MKDDEAVAEVSATQLDYGRSNHVGKPGSAIIEESQIMGRAITPITIMIGG